MSELFISDIHGEYDAFAHVLRKAIPGFARAQGLTPISRVHMLGDVYDRGPAPQKIMEEFIALDAQDDCDLDIQWGNHDMLWMGAALGQPSCVAGVVRICARYDNLAVLEEAYGMDLSVYRQFAAQAYADDPCVGFKLSGHPNIPEDQMPAARRLQKAIAYIQFKVDAQTIADNPGFGMEERNLLDKIDYVANTITVEGQTYPLTDAVFPTIDPTDPYRLTDEEQEVIDSLVHEFVTNEALQKHIRLFIERGSLYKIVGGDLLLHAAVPLNADGSLMEASIFGKTYKGKALYDAVDTYVRDAFNATDPADKKRGRDLIWHLWLWPASPLFSKSKMATLEAYLIEDKATHKEHKNPFYTLNSDESVMANILSDFGLDPQTSRVICGHTPVKVKDGEDPVKGNGKLIIIDGGFSGAYHKTTGIAGFALVEEGAYGAADAKSWLITCSPMPAADEMPTNWEMPLEPRVL